MQVGYRRRSGFRLRAARAVSEGLANVVPCGIVRGGLAHEVALGPFSNDGRPEIMKAIIACETFGPEYAEYR